MAKNTLVICIALVCMTLITSVPKTKAVSCMQVVQQLTPCISYVENGGAVSPQCCNGIRTLLSLAPARQDRQTVCTCIKNAIRGINFNQNTLNLAAGLPSKCRVNIPYQISPSVDCARFLEKELSGVVL
ncbi:hypothetical protein AHAS_Ahas04G0177600 [Arachis hypogaea]